MHDEPEDPFSRSARRNTERALLEERRSLLDDLSALPPEARAAIPADRELLAAIEHMAGMKADIGRRRIIRHYARRTPEAAWPALRAALDHLKGLPPEAIVTPADERAAEWAGRLIEGGDEALAQFLDTFWMADRNHLRRLLRNATSRSDNAGERARAALEAELKTTLAAAEDH